MANKEFRDINEPAYEFEELDGILRRARSYISGVFGYIIDRVRGKDRNQEDPRNRNHRASDLFDA